MASTFGQILKHWREARRYSQLALSVEADMSSRHLSFLETGRSKPSRASVLRLARTLDMPRASVNEALKAAGLSAEYSALALSATELAPAMDAIDLILKNHAPMPAIVIDEAWMIVGGNPPAMAMIDVLPFAGSLCIVDALLNDDPDAPIFLNWETIAVWTLLRLQNEATKAGADSAVAALYQRFSTHPRLKDANQASFSDYGPVLTMRCRLGDMELSLFTMIAEFSTVQDITMNETRVELFFPADEATKAFFEATA
ncbi:helix-turn-helix domain-containing protein [Fretibacter rubidus]|uniref:helix-turn-helix domain-containing protein n=1 Tax=Fretibacter rubidus TaxID=570162 RepID=UPI00352A543C